MSGTCLLQSFIFFILRTFKKADISLQRKYNYDIDLHMDAKGERERKKISDLDYFLTLLS